ncbi:DnaJ-domain-containing protein [Dichomitus squalens]|uniref:DnaJ-domain-containing protein n=1 Tax=Dichomitus squalens TaxID=114155 RepID=A0A4Q9PU78_9APHY|nr:DnaJ-domain-containing protein [Dichomitus squalens LYAD-421 SS1]EJF64955.1 DnaJ-domain-containing protein [Dichomitus squalens LYAD-421 SS1]TBU48855.1 DnaJ-domain-containing protein [Dichomitus squalens]TBU57999.1 DnaJ-domain-containing protein [Dichomitus squalens]
MSEASSTPGPSSSKPDQPSADDIERLLNREATAFQREIEVERILKAFKLNPYEILDISEEASTEEIKKKYRHLSLFIHPDKTPHPRAPDAFDLLKKAESELSDKTKREELDAVIKQARVVLLKDLGLPPAMRDDDPKLKSLVPSWRQQVLAKSKEFLIDEEVRRRKAFKMNLANEGLEARKKEEEVNAKKRKAEEEARWEENREQRVDNWRNFASTSKKKKKTKVAVLG